VKRDGTDDADACPLPPRLLARSPQDKKRQPSLTALAAAPTTMTMDLERGESTEPLSPPSSSNVQPASPANGAEGSNDEAEGSSQPSPVDDASDEDDTSRRHDSAAHEEPAEPPVELPPPASFARIGLKGQGLSEADEVTRANAEVRAAIDALRGLLDGYPMLDVRVAETEAEVLEALKLYRDMNHLSLTGVTCEQVVDHVQSHTINLYYRPEPNEPEITVTAATFTMRQSTMMLRLLATHPRMTRKGFGRVTVHFLKELCRALHKNDILVYTYPSSAVASAGRTSADPVCGFLHGGGLEPPCESEPGRLRQPDQLQQLGTPVWQRADAWHATCHTCLAGRR